MQITLETNKLVLQCTFLTGKLCLVLLQVSNYFWLVQIFSARPKDYFHLGNLVVCAGTNYLGVTENVIESLVWPKKFGLAQNILGPVEGQGIIACPSGPTIHFSFC